MPPRSLTRVYTIIRLALLLGIAGAFTAQAGIISSFAPEILGPASVSAIYPEPGGKVYVSGSFLKADAARNVGRLVRLNSDGSLDQSFTLGPTIDGGISNILPLPDGRICLLGTFTTVGGAPRSRIAILDQSGSLDLTFAPPANALSGTPTYAALDTRGRLLVSMTSNSSLFTTGCVTRLKADGLPDESFRKPTFYSRFYGGIIGANVVFALPSGKILLGGNFESWNSFPPPAGNGFPSPYLTVLNEDGTRDTTFVPPLQIVTTNSSLTGVLTGAALPNGDFVFGGSLGTSRLSFQPAIRLKSDLTVDETFRIYPPAASSSLRPVARRMARNSEGRVVLIGIFSGLAGLSSDVALIVDSLGNIQPSSATLHRFFSDNLAIGADDRIFMAGTGSNQASKGSAPTALDAFSASGQPLEQFHPRLRANRAVDFVTVRSAGRGVLIGGRLIEEVADHDSDGLDAVRANGTFDPAFHCQITPPRSVTFALALPGDRYLLGGSFTAVNGIEARALAVIDDRGALVRALPGTFTPNGTVERAALLPNGKVVVTGSFTKFGNFATNRVAILDSNQPTGLIDTSFRGTSTISGTIYGAVGLEDGSVVIGGYLSNVGGAGINALAKLTSSGELDSTFNPLSAFTSANVTALACDPSGRIVISGTFSQNSTSSSKLMRVSSAGVLDSTFANPSAQSVEGIHIGNNSLIYVRGTLPGSSTPMIGRFFEDGTRDGSFAIAYSNGTGGSKFAFAPPDRLYLCGAFTIDGTSYTGARAFSLDAPLQPILRLTPRQISAFPTQQVALSAFSPGTAETYAWMKDGQPLPGQTGPTLNLGSVSAEDAGTYAITATNVAGSATVFTHLSVEGTPPPTPPAPPSVQTANSPTSFSVKFSRPANGDRTTIKGRISDADGVRIAKIYYKGTLVKITHSAKWKVSLRIPPSDQPSLTIVIIDRQGNKTRRSFTPQDRD